MVHRVAGLDENLCHSDKCGLECIKDCPVNINGDECIVLGEDKLAVISEQLCIGCGICVKVCPFDHEELIPYAMHAASPKLGTGTMAIPAKGKICPTCGGRFDGSATFCGKDGTALVLIN